MAPVSRPAGGAMLLTARSWARRGRSVPALRRNFAAVATGSNFHGALGNGTVEGSDDWVPVQMPDESAGVVAASAGWGHTGLLLEDGAVLLTGKVDDLKGTLFNFNLATRAPQFFSWLNWATSGRTADLVVPTPFAMPDGEAATQVACGGAFSAVLLESGRVAALGNNQYGQLGVEPRIGSTMSRDAALIEGGLHGQTVADIAVGFQHVLARTTAGELWSWGKAQSGQLGWTHKLNLSADPRPVALEAEGTGGDPGPVRLARAGFNHSVAVVEDGTAFVWGKMLSKDLKDASRRLHANQFFPRPLRLPVRCVDAACGMYHTLLVGDDLSLWLVGMPGQQHAAALGVGAEIGRMELEPVLLADGAEVARLTGAGPEAPPQLATGPHSSYLLHGGRVFEAGWGVLREYGQAPGAPVRALSQGWVHTVALVDQGA